MSTIIRPAAPTDGAGVAAIYGPMVEQTAISFETHAPTPAEMSRRIETTVPTHPWLVADDNETILGYIYAHAFAARAAYAWSVETSVYLHPDAQGTGLGRALYDALIPMLIDQGFHRAYAGIRLPNPASVTLHERVGFRQVALYEQVGWKFGEWHDVGWWQRELSPTRPEGQQG